MFTLIPTITRTQVIHTIPVDPGMPAHLQARSCTSEEVTEGDVARTLPLHN